MTDPKRGHGFPVGSRLHRHGPWITDGVWAAHANLSIFDTLHTWLPTRDGVYTIRGGIGAGYTYKRGTAGARMIEGLLAAPRWPARIVERAPHNTRNIETPSEVMTEKEPWYVENPADRAHLITFDGRIAASAELTIRDRDRVDTWMMMHYARGEWALVGLVDDQPKFFLAQQERIGP